MWNPELYPKLYLCNVAQHELLRRHMVIRIDQGQTESHN